MNIVILDDYQDAVRKLACAKKLDPYPAKVFTNSVKGVGQLSVRLRDAEVLVLIRERTVINRALLDKLPRLKMISQTGRVGAHIDVEACTDKGIVVSESTSSPVAAAELTWGLVMSAARRLPQYIANLKHGAWQQSGLKALLMPPNFGLGVRLEGKTFGLWGYGRIGQRVAKYAEAFGMRVLVWGSEQSRQLAASHGFDVAANKSALFANSDVLSLHLRLTSSTRHGVTFEDLALMKPTAILVNTSRAELIVQDALLAGLSRGRPGMAAIDVFDNEPILMGHALLRLENCICSPHIGFVDQENYEQLFDGAFDNAIQFINGAPTNVVNLEVLPLRQG